MGTKQTKGAGPDAGSCSLINAWRRTQSSFRRRSSGERLGRSATPPPYQRRIGMIQDVLSMAKDGKQDEAAELLKALRQDLGMESTSLDDVLYRYASFRNLVDPITHDLIISLARYIHYPKTEQDSIGAIEKVCRQLTYHLSPHSHWRKQSLPKSKPQPTLKASLSKPPVGGTVDLSGIPLCVRDTERLAAHLRLHSSRVRSVELGFTELTDQTLLGLLPTLAALPRLETLALNGNRLTRVVLRHLTDSLKDPTSFPALTWMDLGNNVDIFSLPHPFLMGLRKRCPKQGNLPTIQEHSEGQSLGEASNGCGDEGECGAGVSAPAGTEHHWESVERTEEERGEELFGFNQRVSKTGEREAKREDERYLGFHEEAQIHSTQHCNTTVDLGSITKSSSSEICE